VYVKPAAALLDMTQTELKRKAKEHGGDYIYNLLKHVSIPKVRTDLLNIIETATGQKLDKSVKKLKYIMGLEKARLEPAEAYTGKTIPVIPPIMRPIVPGPNRALLVADANHLYREALLANEKLREMKAMDLPDEDIAEMRGELAHSVGAIVGLNEPSSYKLQQQGKKGFIKKISGSRPSSGFFQRKVVGRAQDVSGRATISPDPTLGVDEIGLPEDSAYGMYKPLVMKNLIRKGIPAVEAMEKIDQRAPVARQALTEEMLDRPVIYNRAPTLHRANMLAAYPIVVPGKTLRINPYSEVPLNADFDGDAVQLHVPVTHQAMQDANKMLLSRNLFSDKTRNDLWVKPQHEAIIGLHEVTSKPSTGKSFTFKNLGAAKKAYLAGDLKAEDEVILKE